MIYYANGGFNWHDLYYMPVKLREFYFRELLNAKEEENDSYLHEVLEEGNFYILYLYKI